MAQTSLRSLFAVASLGGLIACGGSGPDDGGGSGAGGAGSGGAATSGGAPSAAGAGGVAGGVGSSGSAGEGKAGDGSAGDTNGGSATGGSAGMGAASAGTAGTSNGGAAGSAAGGSSGGSAGAGGATCSGTSASSTATDLAFPEAQGFGQHATGGRAGSVYHVTNLNDSGAGSFRDAVGTANRIVIFDVGGYIALETAVSVKSNITIAGQTAPGGGIGFKGGEIGFANSTNIICRHLRVRPGSDTASSTDDALSLYEAQNVIIDHSSFELAPWNNIDGVSEDWQTKPATNITFQDSLIADPTGQQFGAHTESVASQWAWYRNIFANSHNRNPLAKVNTVFVNNVLYNDSAGYTTHTSTNFKHDIVENYFVFGPASTGTDNTWYQVDKNQSIYYAGNLKDSNLNGMLDGAATTPYWYQGTGTVLTAAWSGALAATLYSAPSAFRIATSLAGALPRDPLDALVISQVKTLGKGTTGTGANTVGPDGGLYTSQTQTGLDNSGYGTITSGTKPTDTDGDGMPDFWEKATGSDPATVDATKKASDGYLLIEHYINWLAEPHAQTSASTAVEMDLASIASGFSSVAPVFTVKASCGAVTLLADGHTAHFTPASGFHGVSSFEFAVTGSDKSAYSGAIAVAVQP